MKLVLAALAALVVGVPHGRGMAPVVASTSGAVATSDGATAVNGSRPLLPPEIVRVSGDVVGLPQGVSPSVVVKLNGVPVPSQVTGTSFTADIVAPQDAVVAVEAHAPSVFYRAFAGSVGTLARHAGGDGVVTVAEYEGVRVSPWSTATVFLGERALGRALQAEDDLARVRPVLATPEAWQSFASSHTEHDLGAMAEAMVRIADGRIGLPIGKATGYDVVTDPVAFRAIRSQVDEASRNFVDRAGHRQPITGIDTLPAQLLLGSRSSNIGSGYTGRHAILVTRLQGDRVRVDMSPFSDVVPTDGAVMPGPAMPEFQASLTGDGDLRLVPQTRLAWIVTADHGRTEIELDAMRLQRVAVGPVSLWAVTMDTKSTTSARPDLGTVARRQWSLLWGVDLAAVAQPVAWSAGQRVALRSHCLQNVTAPLSGRVLTPCEAVEYRLDTGGQGWMEDTGWKVSSTMTPQAGAAFGPSFQWSKADDGRRFRLQNSAIATDAWVVGAGDAATDFVLMRSTGIGSDVAGQSTLTLSMAVIGDFVPFATASTAGTWRLPQSSLEFAYPTPFKPAYFVRLATGRSSEYTSDDGINGEAVPTLWETFGGRIYDIRYRARYANAPQQRTVYGCAEAFAEGAIECAPIRIRYFKAMARSGNRIYGYTDFYFNSALKPPGYTGTYPLTRNGGAPLYYDCEAGGCMAAPSASSSLESALVHPNAGRSHRTASDHAHLRLRMHHLRH